MLHFCLHYDETLLTFAWLGIGFAIWTVFILDLRHGEPDNLLAYPPVWRRDSFQEWLCYQTVKWFAILLWPVFVAIVLYMVTISDMIARSKVRRERAE